MLRNVSVIMLVIEYVIIIPAFKRVITQNSDKYHTITIDSKYHGKEITRH